MTVHPIERCTFCRSGREDADLLIKAKVHGVYICSGCVLSALGVLFKKVAVSRQRVRKMLAAFLSEGAKRPRRRRRRT